MVDTVTGLRRVRDRLRQNWGIRVDEMPGWETRGTTALRPAGKLDHFDAIGGSSPVRGLRVCTFGRPDLRNSLCAIYVESGAKAGVWLVAARVSWHAGSGTKGTNTTLIGTEAANNNLGEPVHPDAIYAQAAVDIELAREFGYSTDRTWEHYEHTSRKSDRKMTGSGPAWRHRLRSTAPDGGPAPAPAPAPTEEDDMHSTPFDLDPGESVRLSVEPADGFFGKTQSLLVLDVRTNDGEQPVWVWHQFTGGGAKGGPDGKVVVRGGQRFVRSVSGGWLDVRNDGTKPVFGALLMKRV